MASSKAPAIVLARFSALGDVALSIPALYDLALSNPDKRIVMVTRSWMTALAVNRPANLEVVGVDLKTTHKGLRGMARLVRELTARYDVEAFVDLHDVLRTRFMRLLMRARGVKVTKIDKGRAAKRRLVKVGADAFGQWLEPTIQRYRDAIERAGYRLEPRFTTLFDAPANRQGPRRIGVAPFAAHPGKVYPPDRLESVVGRLASESTELEIYLFGAGEAENAVLARWAESRPNVVNLAAERRGLASELELMSTLDVMVAMDSANMHLASIAGTPRVLSVWGQTHPAAGFTPWHADPADFLQIDLDCRPCSVFGNKPCRYGDFRCLTRLSELTLYSKIKEILNQ